METHLMKSILIALSLTLSASLSAMSVQAEEMRLLMFEEVGCHWCAKWNSKIGPIYPKTAEGRAAPLQRIDIHDGIPASITLKSRPQFTPTFVVIRKGREIGRIEGYPGEDFFWGLMEQILTDTPEYQKEKKAS
jgi:thioredoxin-related protein